MGSPREDAAKFLASYEFRGIFKQLGVRLSVDQGHPPRGPEVHCFVELTTYDTCVYVGEKHHFRRKFWINMHHDHKDRDAAVWAAIHRMIWHECLEGLYRNGRCVPKDPHA